MRHNQQIGKWGEQAAAEYLQKLGYEILDKNARTPFGEIDLVARLEAVTIFVEVKARTTRSFGLPEEAITPRKLSHMLACADLPTQGSIVIDGTPSLGARVIGCSVDSVYSHKAWIEHGLGELCDRPRRPRLLHEAAIGGVR